MTDKELPVSDKLSAYTGDAHALEEKQLEQCIDDLEQLLARQAPGGVT